MSRLKNTVFYAVMGGCAGLTGFLPPFACSGGSCTTCYGCAGAGALLGLLLLLSKHRKNEKGENRHGMAEVNN